MYRLPIGGVELEKNATNSGQLPTGTCAQEVIGCSSIIRWTHGVYEVHEGGHRILIHVNRVVFPGQVRHKGVGNFVGVA